MKKVLRILLITIGVVLMVLILVPVLFKSRIEAVVKDQVNQSVNAEVDWDRFGLSFFRGFPSLSVNLHGMSVVGVGPFEGDTLAGLDRFELRVQPFSALKRQLKVHSMVLDRPLVNGIVREGGSANWDIAASGDPVPVVEEEESEKGGGSFGVNLERFAIREGRIAYRDAAAGLDASMKSLDLELSGDFSLEETELDLEVKIAGIDATMGGIRYLRDGVFALALKAEANMAENRYILRENEFRLNGLVLGLEGEVAMPEGAGTEMDLRFHTKETSFQTLLSLVPAIYLQDFESLETRGRLALEGTVKGTMVDSLMPDATLDLRVTDGYFSYPDLPEDVSAIQIRLLADYHGSDMDRSTLDLEQFSFLLGGNPFEMSFRVADPVSDMHLQGGVDGTVDFATLKDAVPMEEVDLEGSLSADLHVDTRMSYIEQERFEEVDLEGRLLLEELMLDAPDIPVPVRLRKLDMVFNPRIVELAALDLSLGSSDLAATGSLTGFIPYLFEDATVSGSLAVSSRNLDVNELLPSADSSSAGDSGVEPEPGEPDVSAMTESASASEPVRIPENLDFRMDLDLERITYENVRVENISGAVNVRDGIASLEGLEMEIIEGTARANGTVDTRGDRAETDLGLDLEGVDIPSAYSTFVTVRRLAPMAEYCQGKANVQLRLNSLLDAAFTPVFESIEADGRIFTDDLRIYNTRSFVRISELLKNEKFREMAPDNLDIKFRVREGRVIVDPFDLEVEDSRMTVSGSHGIDLTMDYLLDMQIARNDLGEGANTLMNSVSALAAGAGLNLPESEVFKVKARVTGTFSDPKISTDLTGNLSGSNQSVRKQATERVKEEVKQEVEKVEERAREEASEKAGEILKEARAEADKVMEEARRAGEDLVKEAELQGENLVKEAGNNPIKKIAAQRAADELVAQANKQSENLLREARTRADSILEKARQEAESIED